MRGEAFYFGAPGRPLAGWLHRAAGAGGELGLVVVNPFGYEAVCAHRSLRHLAEESAAAGVAALRFDLDGTGDSAGDDRDPDRLGAWIGSVRLAIDELRRAAGVRRVVLFGVRLGAALAVAAAADRDDVAGVIALAPVISGRAYLRELKALQAALGLTPGPTVEEGIDEALGFVLTAETRAALGKLDVTALPAPRELLLLDRDDLPAGEKWREKLAAAGASLDARRVPGYVEMVRDPHDTVVPAAVIGVVTEWLRARQQGSPAPAGGRGPTEVMVTPEVRERAVVVDDELAGVAAEPLRGARGGRAILLLNAGAVHRIGPNRLYTRLARRWAARGDLVLRLDVAGIGESRPRPGRDENIVYSPRAVEDVRAGLAWLRRQAGVGECVSVGLCSGAYHSFKAAVAGEAVARVIMINPLTFFFKDGDSLAPPRHRAAEDAARYRKSARSLDKWKQLLRGEVDVRRLVRTVRAQVTARTLDHARDLSRRAGMPWKEDLGAELEAVARRKVGMRFVFATGEPGPILLRDQGGSATVALRRSGAIRETTLEGPDHTFTPVWSHDVLIAALDEALET